MKKIVTLLMIFLFALPILTFALSDVTLIWNCEDTNNLTGYKIYRATESGAYDPNNPVSTILDPNIMNFTDTNLPDGIYYWIVRAFFQYIPYENAKEITVLGDMSNEVSVMIFTAGIPTVRDLKVQKIDLGVIVSE